MENILQYIVHKYSLNFISTQVKEITSSKNNRVFDLGDFILKVSDKKYNLKNEFEVLNLIDGQVDCPKLILYDILDEKHFILLKKLKGKTLDHYWLDYSTKAQIDVLQKITTNLKKIHSFRSDSFISHIGGNKIKKDRYFEILKFELNMVKKEAFENPYVDSNTLNSLLNIFEKNKDIFSLEEPQLIHNDLWYKNILGDNHGFTAIIDFEISIFAPKQIELFKIYNHLFFAKNYFDNNPEEYKEFDFLQKFIHYLRLNYKELFYGYDDKQKLLFDIVTYFRMLSKFKESWYSHSEVEKFGDSIVY